MLFSRFVRAVANVSRSDAFTLARRAARCRRENSALAPAGHSETPPVVEPTSSETHQDDFDRMRDCRPEEIFAELNKHIVGQADAKKAVAIALRNRWRRQQLSKDLQQEVAPKNILMVGPTGVGKTEIARRLAKLTNSPFIKAEATKFTMVGYHGRDVDTIIKDLAMKTHQEMRKKFSKRFTQQMEASVEKKLVDRLTQQDDVPGKNVHTRQRIAELLRSGSLKDKEIPGEGGASQKKVSQIEQELIEQEKANATDLLKQEAIKAVEENGIVFIDEIDKICLPKEMMRHGAEASSEGVQRDLLPLIEGTSVMTKIGKVDTHKILFIASGAFHSCKPSDLMAELQGRLPIRVELKALTQQDLFRILTEPEFNLIWQQVELMKAEGIALRFTDEAVHELASVSAEINLVVENIGARRLHTVIEKVMEELSFNCDVGPKEVVIDAQLVRKCALPLLERADLKTTIL